MAKGDADRDLISRILQESDDDEDEIDRIILENMKQKAKVDSMFLAVFRDWYLIRWFAKISVSYAFVLTLVILSCPLNDFKSIVIIYTHTCLYSKYW